MICQKCKYENYEAAKFCKKCGWDLSRELSPIHTNIKDNSTIIGIVGILIVFQTLFWWFAQFFGMYWIYDIGKYLINPLVSASPFILSFAVKNSNWKVILIILGIVEIVFAILGMFGFFY
jgi:hypothetical protein|tara:strand:- start:913 stop:1272 length:360 start_codon:yes stop_codon:yes gene_type:complete